MNHKKLSITVEWSTFGEEADDKKAQDLYELSVQSYIERFNALPLIGMHIGNGYCDSGKISQIDFDGCNDSLYVFLDF